MWKVTSRRDIITSEILSEGREVWDLRQVPQLWGSAPGTWASITSGFGNQSAMGNRYYTLEGLAHNITIFYRGKRMKAPELYEETPWFILGLVLKGLVSGETFSRNESPDGHLLFFSSSTYLAQYWQTSSLSLSINLADTHLAPALPRGPAHPNLLPWMAPPNQHLAHLIQRLALSSTNTHLLYQANMTGYRFLFKLF